MALNVIRDLNDDGCLSKHIAEILMRASSQRPLVSDFLIFRLSIPLYIQNEIHHLPRPPPLPHNASSK
jgi:hypothetical protein